ncbi:RNA polymerase-binding transcription factor DksA [Dehalogenimonas formicexedens]|uniref:RNA polymerase-binding transcription factor DksA n=1 Tax=Dehalogenimonas formicexedens TaxID=1839801 RepID=A0A1P8F4X2_9CHLR|nr:TraR/DksA C4-type zinc finger protein [Dehalogenimonas formicexedens]APV43531.1 RNA polymerase-binding transcription factor DksA [Dehalogenimonas formicexedens]
MATEKKNYDEVTNRLKADYQRLSEQLEALKASAPQEDRREGSPFGKREEEATETADLENRLALEKRVLDQMAEVEYALSKINKGTFGRCENCGQTIDPARLEILPYAKLCVTCKTKLNRPG